MTKQWQISRRTVLRGLGTAIALPVLQAMEPALALAAAGGKPSPPKRMAFLFVPNGVHVPDWTPGQTGWDYELPYILTPLKRYRDTPSTSSIRRGRHAGLAAIAPPRSGSRGEPRHALRGGTPLAIQRVD